MKRGDNEAEKILREGVYVNWVDSIVLVAGKVVPFSHHEEYHNTFNRIGFCPVCGERLAGGDELAW